MIIKQVYTTVLSFPTAHHISGWRPVTRTFHLVIFLLTDDDIVGIGEGTPYWSNIVDDYAKTLSLARRIQGLSLEDVLDILRSSEYSEFRRREQVNYGAFLVLESAIIHVLAQSKKLKYEAEVMGGVYRSEVPVAYTIFLSHPGSMSHKLVEAIKLGFNHVKIKIPCNLEELRKLLEVLYSVKRQYDEKVVLRADANECFSTFEKAEKALLIMEQYGIDIVEQPMPRNMLRDIAKLRKRFHPAIEIMLDESLRNPFDIELFAQLEVADAINFHPSKLGCLTITREAILQTQKLGMKANIGSALMTEIGLFHYLNLAASIPRLDYPLEELGLYNFYGYGVTRNPLEILNGELKLQNASLLSSDLDFDLMKKFVIKRHEFLINQILRFLGKGLRIVKLH
jgi:L-alanine-DL-glutamate epimerase-like enolase superfamily enzyme